VARLYNYDDFDLQIQPAGENYRVQLLNSPSGQVATTLVIPFTSVEVSNFLSRIGKVRRSMRGSAGRELTAAKEFGGKLFDSLFSGELRGSFRSSLDRSVRAGKGLRIRLRLTDVPEIADLPWEFLYDAKSDVFWATSTETPVVRFPDLPQAIEPLRVQLPLRVLVVIASPKTLPTLDTQGEWERLNAALAGLQKAGKLVLERLEGPTLDNLRLRARGEPFHIFHFIGHGDFDNKLEDGFLQFATNTGMADPVPGWRLGMLLRDHRPLRLAVLNACEGARQSQHDPFSGVAQSLLRQRVPAVIAMQFEISDDAAKMFAAEFYSAVADGIPVDAAVSECRKALFQQEHSQEWATPVLYMRAKDGVLFKLSEPRAQPGIPVDVQKRPDDLRPVPAARSPFAAAMQVRSIYQRYRWVGICLAVVGLASVILPLWMGQAQSHLTNGDNCFGSRNFEGAIKEYKLALAYRSQSAKASSKLAEALFEKGRILYDKQNYGDAIEAYREAVRHRSDYADAYNNLVVVLLVTGQQADAISRGAEAPEKAQSADFHYNLGNALYKNGDYSQAKTEYMSALDLRNDFAYAHNNLGVIFYWTAIRTAQDSQGKTDTADSNPTDSLEQAIKEFEQAMNTSQYDCVIRENLRNAYYDRGLYELEMKTRQLCKAIESVNSQQGGLNKLPGNGPQTPTPTEVRFPSKPDTHLYKRNAPREMNDLIRVLVQRDPNGLRREPVTRCPCRPKEGS
jgi:CHAT domain/TPR repeat